MSKTLQERWDDLPDARMAMLEVGLDEPNPAMILKKILANNDEVLMAQLEAVAPIVETKLRKFNALYKTNEKVELGKHAAIMLKSFLEEKSLTEAKLEEALIELEKPCRFLEAGQLTAAINQIGKIALPGVISDDEREEVISYLETKALKIEERYTGPLKRVKYT